MDEGRAERPGAGFDRAFLGDQFRRVKPPCIIGVGERAV
jgi:hypothetical protein